MENNVCLCTDTFFESQTRKLLLDFQKYLAEDKYGMDAAMVHLMNSMKRNYVMERHSRKISKMPPNNSFKTPYYKTHVYVGSKRKEITATTEAELIEKLFRFYNEEEKSHTTLAETFKIYEENKKTLHNIKERTLQTDRNRFSKLSQKLLDTPIAEITEDDIQKFIVSEFLPQNPKRDALKRTLQLLNAVFAFGIRKRLCVDNPMEHIDPKDYYKDCDSSVKSDEQQEFSHEELVKLSEDMNKELDNPRVLMALLSKETGMRAGELASLHREDILDEYLHVHRQQVRGEKGFIDVPYTKDERACPRNGRYIPITDDARSVIELAFNIPGDSVYLFHNPGDSGMIPKDSYEQNLFRRCKRLGCLATNNHAFRKSFNTRLIELGFTPAERALIMGHSVQINESCYSLTDMRQLERLKERLVNNKKEP